MSQPERDRFELRQYVRILNRRRWTIISVTVGVVAVALALSLVQTRVYRASAEILLEPRQIESVFTSGNAPQSSVDDTVETEGRVMRSDAVRRAVRRELGSTPKISTSRVAETEVMKVSADSPNARRAARIANAYANAYTTFRKSQAVGDLDSASASIKAKIGDLQEAIQDNERQLSQTSGAQQNAVQARHTSLLTQQGLLAQKLDSLQVDATLKSGGAQLVKVASVPGSPASPKPLRNLLIALFVGGLVGTAIALLRERLDDSVKSKADLAAALPDAPVLGVLPVTEDWDESTRDAELQGLRTGNNPSAEAYRDLRTSVHLLGVERPLRTLQITSPLPREGKTTVVAKLGVVTSAPGERVLLVDCDLRRPALHRMFGIPNDRGFTSIFLEGVDPLAAVQRVPHEDSLFILPSGPLPPNPSELLGSKRTAEVLFELSSTFDFIIVDSAPVLPVTDAIVLAAWVEATLMVAKGGATSSQDLHEASERLRRLNSRLVGTVLNGAGPEAADGYSYGYSYTSTPTG